MFVYLSKRIAIPHEATVTAIRWNEGEGWLACGTKGGLLKVLKVDSGPQKSGGISFNQSIEDHESTVNIVAWNEQGRRLTSSDEAGQIIVWTFHKTHWRVGIMNNRKKSRVVDLAWSLSGKKICITYADGAVIVGGIDGNRFWSLELPHELEKCCWSADDMYVLFATRKGEVLVFDAGEGAFMSKITIQCLDESDLLAFQMDGGESGENGRVDGSSGGKKDGKGGKVGSSSSGGGADGNGKLPDGRARAPGKGEMGEDGSGGGEKDMEDGNGASTSGQARHHRVVSLEWCSTWVDRPEPLPMLAITYENGKIQLMRTVSDDHPVIFDCGLPCVRQAAWNPQGSCLAVCGVLHNGGMGIGGGADAVKSMGAGSNVLGVTGGNTSTPPPADGTTGSVISGGGGGDGASSAPSTTVGVNFFSIEGKLLRTLRVVGSHCGGITWEGDGLRIALAVDSSVYFANICPEYHYGFLHSTAIFAFNRPDKVEDSICFWNTVTGDRKIRHLHRLRYIGTSKDVCLIVSQPEDHGSIFSGGGTVDAAAGEAGSGENASKMITGGAKATITGGRTLRRGGKEGSSMVQLLNSICCPLSTRFVEIAPPVACGINNSYVVMCGDENIYLWQFRDPTLKVDAVDPVSMQISTGNDSAEERIFHIDELVRPNVGPSMSTRTALTNDLICTCALSDEYLIVARESGLLHLYQIRPLRLIGKLLMPSSRPQAMQINCDSTMLAVVDMGGVLYLFPLERETWTLIPRKATPLQGFDHKDVWCMRWAEDDPKLFACMEKTRLFIFHGLVGEEPVVSMCHLFQFKDLEVKGIQFDEILYEPEKPRKDSLHIYETSVLRDVKELLAGGSLQESYKRILEDPHERLWELLAEEALTRLDFPHAEMAIIAKKDYPSLQFVKRVKALDDPRKQLAEIEAFHRHFEASEKIYKLLDRKDLALEMRQRLGDWFGVVRLVQEGGGDESRMVFAWENIGDSYAEGMKWNKAAQYYAQCRNFRKLAYAYYGMENYEMLVQLIKMVEHDKELLVELGEMLLTVGLAEEAAQAFLAAGEPRRAVDGCVGVSSWDRAISLAEEHQLPEIPQLLQKYARYLIRREKLPEAIELYQKAGEHDEAAKILLQLGSRAAVTDPLRAKKFYVLAALEVEKYRHRQLALNREGGEVIDAMLRADYKPTSPDRLLDNAWRGAEAYHFFLLCQKHLTKNHLEIATILAVRLMEYDDVISLVDSYCLIALTAYLAGNYGLCSKAFSRLEGAERMDAATGGEGGSGAGGAAAGILQRMDFTTDLDVTSRGGGGGETMMTMGGGVGGFDGSMMGTMSGMGIGAGNLLGGVAGGGAGGSMLSSMTIQLTPTSGGGRGGEAAAANHTTLTYPTVSLDETPARFADLAVKIFTKHPPITNSVDSVTCGNCSAYNKEWSSSCVKCGEKFGTCIASGKCIPNLEDAWECSVCRHFAIELEIEQYSNCPLCHAPIKHRLRRGIVDF